MAVKGAGRRVDVSDEDRRELERIVRASSSEVRMVERAGIVWVSWHVSGSRAA
jgi:hypothetical protein